MDLRMKKTLDRWYRLTYKQSKIRSGSGSGGTVGSEVSTAVGRGPSGTFARPPQGVAVRLNDLFMPRRMEFKGWVTDYMQCRYQGLTSAQDGTCSKKTLIRSKPGTNKERGQPKLW